MAVLDRLGVEANTDAVLLLLSGEPIDGPIVGNGPFVMNDQTEVAQAVADFNAGRCGAIACRQQVVGSERPLAPRVTGDPEASRARR